MGVVARMKSIAGGKRLSTLTSATSLKLPNDSNQFLISGTATVTSLNSSNIQPGRQVTIIGSSGTTTLTHTAATTTDGQMDLGGQNRAIAAEDAITLVQQNNGSWRIPAFPQVTPSITTITAASNITLTDGIDTYLVSGSTSINTVTTTTTNEGRRVTFMGNSGTPVFVNNGGTVTAYQMDLRGDDRTLGVNAILQLFQRTDGSWGMAFCSN